MKHQSMSNHIFGYIVLVALLIILVFGISFIFSPRLRKKALKPTYLTLAGIIALYLVLRGIAEFWVINYSDPASYRLSWGGPSLLGVFAVHTGPGLVILTALLIWLYQRIKKKKIPK